MVEETFYITTEERMNETKDFICKNMLTARFKRNPTKIFTIWEFSISYELEDMNKLTTLLNHYHDLDNTIVIKLTFWEKLKLIFN